MITVRPVALTKKELRKFVQFGLDIYAGNSCYVPPLIYDEVNTLLPGRNPAFDTCTAQAWMAYRDDVEPVGRICAIINNVVNARTGRKDMRFGFTDFIDDAEVVDALFKAAEAWGREQGMERIVGPMGFTDLDHEGMLTFGYDEMGTMATIYNYPYYPAHMKRMGFEKEVDYVEYRISVPKQIPEKFHRIAEIVRKRSGLSVKQFKSKKELKNQYGKEIFRLINEAYDSLYGFSPLTPKQVSYYIDMYLGILNLENVCLIVDSEDKLVCVGISLPSMSVALRKSKGKLFPTGWWHLLGALRGNTNVVDLLLVAVKPEYQNKGVNALLFDYLIPQFNAAGYEFAETNVELEDNENVQRQWELFERRLHRRRRIWSKKI